MRITRASTLATVRPCADSLLQPRWVAEVADIRSRVEDLKEAFVNFCSEDVRREALAREAAGRANAFGRHVDELYSPAVGDMFADAEVRLCVQVCT